MAIAGGGPPVSRCAAVNASDLENSTTSPTSRPPRASGGSFARAIAGRPSFRGSPRSTTTKRPSGVRTFAERLIASPRIVTGRRSSRASAGIGVPRRRTGGPPIRSASARGESEAKSLRQRRRGMSAAGNPRSVTERRSSDGASLWSRTTGIPPKRRAYTGPTGSAAVRDPRIRLHGEVERNLERCPVRVAPDQRGAVRAGEDREPDAHADEDDRDGRRSRSAREREERELERRETGGPPPARRREGAGAGSGRSRPRRRARSVRAAA